MLRFKQYLKEHLYASEKYQVSEWEPRTPEATAATDHYFGKGNEDKHEELEGTKDKSEMHKAIERHLRKDIPHDDYKSGMTSDQHGRPARIGRILNKSKAPEHLARGFENDSTRPGKNLSGLTVHTTRSAEGIAGQTSHGQSWEQQSCINFNDGMNNHYLPHEVKHGTVVSYLKDKDGKELARATFQPHHNKEGNTAYRKDSYYGIDHAGFKEHNDKTEKELSQPHHGTNFYTKDHHVYSDNGKETMLHPKTSHEDITKALNDNSSHNNYIKAAALNHSGISHEHIDKALDDPEKYVRDQAIQHPNATNDHIRKALADKHEDVRIQASYHPKINSDNIHKALNDDSPYVREAGARSKNATAEHISKALKDEESSVRHAALYNPNATHEHLMKGLEDESRGNRMAALRNENATPEHFKKALNDKEEYVRKFAKEKLEGK
jgi:hypothetical protein